MGNILKEVLKLVLICIGIIACVVFIIIYFANNL